MCERNLDRLPLAGTLPETQACALTENWTSNLSLCGMMLNQLTHLGQGSGRFSLFFFLFKDFTCLSLERGQRREKERERNIDVRQIHGSVASHTLPAGDLALRHVPWLEIEPVTFQFAGWHSVHWATPAKTDLLIYCFLIYYRHVTCSWGYLAKFTKIEFLWSYSSLKLLYRNIDIVA